MVSVQSRCSRFCLLPVRTTACKLLRSGTFRQRRVPLIPAATYLAPAAPAPPESMCTSHHLPAETPLRPARIPLRSAPRRLKAESTQTRNLRLSPPAIRTSQMPDPRSFQIPHSGSGYRCPRRFRSLYVPLRTLRQTGSPLRFSEEDTDGSLPASSRAHPLPPLKNAVFSHQRAAAAAVSLSSKSVTTFSSCIYSSPLMISSSIFFAI